jgi:hypothetical protein
MHTLTILGTMMILGGAIITAISAREALGAFEILIFAVAVIIFTAAGPEFTRGMALAGRSATKYQTCCAKDKNRNRYFT